MCERMLGSKGLVLMTLWWMPVLVASRLSVVGYTSLPAHKTENVQDYADSNFSISDHCKRFCMVSNHILLCGSYLGLDALFDPTTPKTTV